MEEIKKINTVAKIPNERGFIDYYADGAKIDRFRLLSIAYELDDEEKAKETLWSAKTIYGSQNDPVFDNLYSAVMEVKGFDDDSFSDLEEGVR